MKVDKWILWYDDGSRIDSTQMSWEAAKQEGVVHLLVLFDDGTSRGCSGQDLYWMNDFGDGLIYAHDNDRDTLLRRFPWVKFGRWASDHRLQSAIQDADQIIKAWHEERYGKAKEDCGCK